MKYTRVKHSRQENRYKNKKSSPIPLNLKKMSNFACHKNKNSYGNCMRDCCNCHYFGGGSETGDEHGL